MYCLISFVTAYVLELVLIPFAWKLKENVLWGSVVGTTMIVACVLIHENNWQFIRYDTLFMRPSSIGGAALCVALCLSVCLSVCPVIVAIGHDFSAPLASRMYFSSRTEGRISYGHLGRTDSCYFR